MTKTPFNEFKNKALIISGFPKSGTTLLQALLDNHPQLVVFPEELHFGKMIYATKIAGKKLDKLGKINRLLKLKNLKYTSKVQYGISPVGMRDYSDIDYNFFEKELRKKIQGIKTNKELLLAIIEAFYEINDFDNDQKSAWVEKTPDNYFYFYFFKKWFGGDLVWLHVKRNPYDNFVSYRKIVEKGKNLKKKRSIKRFCSDWILSNKLAFLAHKSIKNHYIIQYEDLLREPEKIMRKICGWIGVDFHENVLKPSFLGKEWLGNSMHNQVFSGISTKPIGRYKKLMSEEEIKEMQDYLEKFNLRFWLHIQKRLIFFKLRRYCPPLYRFFLKILIKIKELFQGKKGKYDMQFMREQ